LIDDEAAAMAKRTRVQEVEILPCGRSELTAEG
jgi:hypothetical protein